MRSHVELLAMRRHVELLIVLLILFVLGLMLVPAVLKIRQSAARTECMNHCRQITTAVADRHDTYAAFPAAARPNTDLPPEKRLSWMVEIVPFVEASSLYNRINKETSWDAEANRFAAELHYRIFRCPGYNGSPPESSLVPTHYVGISGVGDNAIALPREDSRAGIFGYDRPVKQKELTRGAGQTLLAVETCRARGAWTAAGPPTTRGLVPDDMPYLGRGRPFGGNHPGGANVVFADGSARFVEEGIDPAVWEAMATLGGKGNQE